MCVGRWPGLKNQAGPCNRKPSNHPAIMGLEKSFMLMGLAQVWSHRAAPGRRVSPQEGEHHPCIPKSCLLKVSWHNVHSSQVELTPGL